MQLRGALALGDLVSRGGGKSAALTAAVEVNGLAQVGAAHGAALNVPARTAHAVGALPGRLTGLGCFPDGKVRRVFFQVIVHLMRSSRFRSPDRPAQVAQFAVLGVALGRGTDDAVLGNVSVAGVDQALDDIEDLLDVLARGWTVGFLQLRPAASLRYSASKRWATSFMEVPPSWPFLMSLSSISVMLET